MIKWRNLLLLVFFLFFNCIGVAIKEKVIGNFYLMAVDVDEQLSLVYHRPLDGESYGGVVEATVFAVGFNKDYIIVKQHPLSYPKFRINRSVTDFFIVPTREPFNYRTMNNMFGPLTLKQFNEKRKELNIPDSIKFTIVKDDLE